jgi:hypothetical protein
MDQDQRMCERRGHGAIGVKKHILIVGIWPTKVRTVAELQCILKVGHTSGKSPHDAL